MKLGGSQPSGSLGFTSFAWLRGWVSICSPTESSAFGRGSDGPGNKDELVFPTPRVRLESLRVGQPTQEVRI